MANIRIEVLNKCEQVGRRRVVNVYLIYISKELPSKLHEEICGLFYNKVIQDCRYYSYNENLEEVQYNFIEPQAKWGLEISFLPGMTDNVGNTAKQIVREYLINKDYIDENVCIKARSSKLILSQATEDDIKQEFNPITEYCTLICKENNNYSWKYYGKYKANSSALSYLSSQCPDTGIQKKDVDSSVSYSNDTINGKAKSVNLNVIDQELEKISRDGIDGNGTLGLSLAAMRAIKDYFKKLGRNPYDIELESLAQTWSEHCKHNIFSSPIDEIKDGLYEHYIKRATREINSDICVSVFSDNAGGIIFDDDYLIVDKVETHNSPSALDPFGGAMTGVLGVNRDIVGFGKGAEPIMNTYYFCFAKEAKGKFYRDKERTDEILPPKYIMKEVIHGVNVAGNCSGIPTQLGSVYFDDRFCGKPLVFVGSVGIIPRNINNAPSHIKGPKNGDKIVIIGGRVGRDGIHGATFSSEALSGNSPSTIVQIGDPITQKKLSNAVIKARDLGLYNAITDNGAGGLSSSIGEMGKDGFEVDLSKVLLKNDGMAPWEIWISESQERMTLAVPEENLPMFKQIMKKHDVEVCVIGEFNESGKAVVKCPKGTVIMDIGTEFLHDGNPKMHLQTKPWSKGLPAPRAGMTTSSPSLEIELKEMLSRPNICSKEFIVVQYDHEVQGSSVLKPLQGKGRMCSEAIVSRPVLSSNKGVVKSQGFGSSYGEIDTYHMAACAIDTAIRNYVAAGGNINHLALLDNFCWCDAYNPERLWQLKKAAEACYDFATAFKTPFISGKDSMFNDFKGYDENGEKVIISAPPSLLISAIGIIENIENAVSLDVKMPGDLIYVLGETLDELGRSEYQLYSGIGNNNVPKVDAKSARKLYERYNQAIKDGIIASAIAPNLGGLVIALAKSLIAGDLGAEIDLSLVPIGKIQNTDIINKIIMFSESQSRILVTIAPQNQKRFEELFEGAVYSCIGKVTEKKVLNIKDVLKVDLKDVAC
ncbi:phosphoribosylformylglycinamidine synthase subunit PurL [Wolbachia pipientis]|uniref:phosphoribosylformylglycinamidine synthase subunit PurL n=1 Tax=unclassified Wolbachia TaxID=2640676 RepID=UPI000198659A|nr:MULTISPECIES: AIR synthase-related protein [unclassified Wolbachia]POG51790.1 phosphoribosylformylglycinamidine synthase [Wolbachia sp. wRi_2]ACN95601.1 phosphoribosylformylglycinamidine synthase II domain protein [Wolbachia sp. wRi]QEF50555.1 AIR synthase related, C-terminal domain protein [Wolbachia endosymbiont of Drosophila ananassae]RLT61640.1 AIR synthase related, C-terminal domain protein [Wolbachia endosymbiont of Drosophila ananassae]RLT61763.1 AIR synthase related, C-terminal doma